jgi:hypothetical protein
MALETGLVLDFCNLSGILAERNQTADAPAPSRRHVIAARTVAGLAGLLFKLIAGVEQKNLAHHRLGKFLELRGVASLANFAADVGGFFGGGGFDGPHWAAQGKESSKEQSRYKCLPHLVPPLFSEINLDGSDYMQHRARHVKQFFT